MLSWATIQVCFLHIAVPEEVYQVETIYKGCSSFPRKISFFQPSHLVNWTLTIKVALGIRHLSMYKPEQWEKGSDQLVIGRLETFTQLSRDTH